MLRNVLAKKKDQLQTKLRLDLDVENRYLLEIADEEVRKISLPRAIDIAYKENILELDEVDKIKEDIIVKYISTILDNRMLWKGMFMRTLGFSSDTGIKDGKIDEILDSYKEIVFVCSDLLTGERCTNYINPWSLSLGSLFRILHRWMMNISVQ